MIGMSAQFVLTKTEFTVVKINGWPCPTQLRKAALYASHSRAPGRPIYTPARELSATKWEAMCTLETAY